MNLSARLKRLEQETDKESQPVYLWANSPAEVEAVADKYWAENPGDQSRLVIFRWLEPTSAAAIAERGACDGTP